MKIDVFGHIRFEELVKMAVQEKCEIEISIEPDEARIKVRPWKPFEYTCPKAETVQTVKKTNLDIIRNMDADAVASFIYGTEGGTFCMETSDEECEEINADCRICLAKWLRKEVDKE